MPSDGMMVILRERLRCMGDLRSDATRPVGRAETGARSTRARFDNDGVDGTTVELLKGAGCSGASSATVSSDSSSSSSSSTCSQVIKSPSEPSLTWSGSSSQVMRSTKSLLMSLLLAFLRGVFTGDA